MGRAEMDLSQRYKQWQPIGEGGSAIVYRAWDDDLEVDVAIKLLKPAVAGDERMVEGLRHEVRVSRQLRHPGICAIHDLYEGPQGVGVVMDLVSGQALRGWMDRHKGDLMGTAGDRLVLLKMVTETLRVAHRTIVHRDLKPANIFLSGQRVSHPVIMDFGISTLGSWHHDGVSGTPKYMAPEQYLFPQRVDSRSDLFSLGVVAYELFTNEIPQVSLRNIVASGVVPRVNASDIPLPSSYCAAVPPALDQLILQLLQYELEDRPASADQLVQLLDQISIGEVELSGCGTGLLERESVVIAGGGYDLGSGPESSSPNEKPRRRVQLTPFRMDCCPVTNRAYRKFITSTGYRSPAFIDEPLLGADDYPVVGVTHQEAMAYAKWAGGELPSEAQWEVAAKGGARFSRYPWGDSMPTAVEANIGLTHSATTAVKSFPLGKNGYGLWDMCGNVWEWCSDQWDPAYYKKMAHESVDPLSMVAPSAQEYSLRGGAYDALAVMGRCAFRFHADAGSMLPSIGFRLVYDLDEPSVNE
ncbi:MAG: SUMF1/EgtB/PvdO family nonheme iron enzyme [Gammaproteobacteria bacterium]|jgi:formylglycine-generating enzyme required for sulfatase activity/tRNA A-37 threonylcarbamoyl transferase component Bud32|nr:SUMF1/EgtB/PvdO family nonheme iron enzyme [Gammaproteobacteria bacterium]MBT7307349.1 SUMF1/EgtB/PvdO family nonheme iron enzyme [Gammaproteobacteria bacterium]